MPEVEDRIKKCRSLIDAQIETGGRHTKLMIDGGIKPHNAALVDDWGIDIAVVGSGLINDNGTIKYNLDLINEALNN